MTTADGVSVGARTTEEKGKVRTDMFCHECHKNFVAMLDLSQDGTHVLICPTPGCAHEHFRVIENGVVTGERWQSSGGGMISARTHGPVDPQRIQASSRSQFLRDLWNNRDDT